MDKEFPSMTYKQEGYASLSSYSIADIREELNKREEQVKEDLARVVHELYDFGYDYASVKELLDEI